MSKFRFVKGRKKPNDVLIFYNDLPVKMEDVAKLCLMFMKNEDNLYPPEQGFKGAKLFKEYFYETLETRKLPKNSKFKIKKNKRTHITNDGVIKEIL